MVAALCFMPISSGREIDFFRPKFGFVDGLEANRGAAGLKRDFRHGSGVCRHPLVLAVGPSAELRRPLGITIIGGPLVSQILMLYTTPVIYLSIDRLRAPLEPRAIAAPAE